MKPSGLVLLAATAALCATAGDAFVTPPNQCTNYCTTATTTPLYDTPEPLAEEGVWQAFLDEDTTGLIYYFNAQTGESLWEPPTKSFPDVRLPRKKQRLADDLRRAYRRQRQAQEEQAKQMEQEAAPVEKETPNWIEGIGVFDNNNNNEAAAAAESVRTDGKDLFGSLFKSKQQEQVEEVDELQLEEQRKLDESMFGNLFKPKAQKQPKQEMIEEEYEEPMPMEENFDDAPVKRSLFGGLKSLASPSAAQEAVEEEQIEVVAPPKPIKIEMASYVSPHPAKVRWGGEDAVFTKGRTFGVFDGVSGADKLDGVPLYSKTLAQEMTRMVGKDSISIAEMTLFLSEAANYADSCATGASTAVVASISENGILQALNVGDSYCIVIRDGRITAKTREISHYWECPYQLSEDSPDRPKDGTKLNVELMSGDLVIMGSDGIFDNMDDDMLVEVAENGPRKASAIARRIVDLSRKLSLDPEAKTPYAKMAKRKGDPDYKTGLGGKVDDSSAVVVVCK
jgi:protein phosphatase PTC7